MSVSSLYIHIPFCASLCDYCDFYSVNAANISEDYIDSFLSALINDIKRQIDFFGITEIPAAYIGGGTPSVLGRKIQVLFNALNGLSVFSPQEFTIEANPESLTEEFLSVCAGYAVNRLSLGIQTFSGKSRIAVNRAGCYSKLEEKLALASRFFCADVSRTSLSCDLITGLPYQSKNIILDDIKRLISFAPSHISLYSLSVDKNTILYKNSENNTIKLPDSDISDILWLTGRETLISAGYEHYEVSNFAYPAVKRCLHNIRYWRMNNWIGAGPAASGTFIDENKGTARRFTYLSDVDAYIKSMNKKEPAMNGNLFNTMSVCEILDKNILLRECLLMGFRYIDGPDPALFFNRFGITLDSCIADTLKKWEGKDKMLFLNKFLSDAFLELDRKSELINNFI